MQRITFSLGGQEVQFQPKENEKSKNTLCKNFNVFWDSTSGHGFAKKILAVPGSFTRLLPNLRTPVGDEFKRAVEGFSALAAIPSLMADIGALGDSCLQAQSSSLSSKAYPLVPVFKAVHGAVDVASGVAGVTAWLFPFAPTDSFFAKSAPWLNGIARCLGLLSSVFSLSYHIRQFHIISQMSIGQESKGGQTMLKESKRAYAIKIAKSVMDVFVTILGLLISLCLPSPVSFGIAIAALTINLVSLVVMNSLKEYFAHTDQYKSIDISDLLLLSND